MTSCTALNSAGVAAIVAQKLGNNSNLKPILRIKVLMAMAYPTRTSSPPKPGWAAPNLAHNWRIDAIVSYTKTIPPLMQGYWKTNE